MCKSKKTDGNYSHVSSIHKLPQDLIIKIIQFLWFQDVHTMMTLSTSIRMEIKYNRFIWNYFFECIMLKCRGTNHKPYNYIQELCQGSLLSYTFSKRITPWPMCIDIKSLSMRLFGGPDNITLVPPPPQLAAGGGGVVSSSASSPQQLRIQYTGQRLGHDRAVVADSHFPCVLLDSDKLVRCNVQKGFEGKLLHRPFSTNECNELNIAFSNAPFTKTVIQSHNPTIKAMMLSCVAYFECSVFEPSAANLQQQIIESQTTGWAPCISIGIACPNFPLRRKQAGWDKHSFGYHSDDGNFYHDHGFGEPMGPAYGAGDTIGCGVIYPPAVVQGRVFFTKNGVVIGQYVWDNSYCTLPWFPIVGLDSYSPIQMNFGEKPFVFDVVKYEFEEMKWKIKSSPSIDVINEAYANTVLHQEKELAKDVFKYQLLRHPILVGKSNYNYNNIKESSLFLDPQMQRNTRFLLDLLYLENLTINGYVDETGALLDEFYVSGEDMDDEEDDDFTGESVDADDDAEDDIGLLAEGEQESEDSDFDPNFLQTAFWQNPGLYPSDGDDDEEEDEEDDEEEEEEEEEEEDDVE